MSTETISNEKELIIQLENSFSKYNESNNQLKLVVNDLKERIRKSNDENEKLNGKYGHLKKSYKNLMVKFICLNKKYKVIKNKFNVNKCPIETTSTNLPLYEGSNLYVNKYRLKILTNKNLTCTSFVRNILTAIFSADELVDHNLKGTSIGKQKLDTVKLNELHEAAIKYFNNRYRKSEVNKAIQEKLLIVHRHLDNIRSNKKQNISSKLAKNDLIGFKLYEDFIKRYNYDDK